MVAAADPVPAVHAIEVDPTTAARVQSGDRRPRPRATVHTRPLCAATAVRTTERSSHMPRFAALPLARAFGLARECWSCQIPDEPKVGIGARTAHKDLNPSYNLKRAM